MCCCPWAQWRQPTTWQSPFQRVQRARVEPIETDTFKLSITRREKRRATHTRQAHSSPPRLSRCNHHEKAIAKGEGAVLWNLIKRHVHHKLQSHKTRQLLYARPEWIRSLYPPSSSSGLSLSLYIVIVTFWLEYGVGHQSWKESNRASSIWMRKIPNSNQNDLDMTINQSMPFTPTQQHDRPHWQLHHGPKRSVTSRQPLMRRPWIKPIIASVCYTSFALSADNLLGGVVAKSTDRWNIHRLMDGPYAAAPAIDR